jgi:hypothetical protein
MNMLLDWLEQRDNYKRDRQAIQDAYDAWNRYRKYQGIEFLDNQENASIMNNTSTSTKQGWNQLKTSTHQDKYLGSYNSSNFKQLPLRGLILEHARINDNIIKRLASNDKMLEDINAKLDELSSAIKDQLNHNKQIESKLSQLAAALPFTTNPNQVQSITLIRYNP